MRDPKDDAAIVLSRPAARPHVREQFMRMMMAAAVACAISCSASRRGRRRFAPVLRPQCAQRHFRSTHGWSRSNTTSLGLVLGSPIEAGRRATRLTPSAIQGRVLNKTLRSSKPIARRSRARREAAIEARLPIGCLAVMGPLAVRPGKQAVDAPARPIGRKSDPFVNGEFEDPQVSHRIEDQPQVVMPAP